MFVDSTPQPCPHCLRPTVLATFRSSRRWVHTATWKPQCEAPSALTTTHTTEPALIAA